MLVARASAGAPTHTATVSAQHRSRCGSVSLIIGIDLLPGLIGIERAHALGHHRRARPEILLEHGAFVIDEERLHAGVAVFGGIGDEGEAADHAATHDIVDGAAAGIGALA